MAPATLVTDIAPAEFILDGAITAEACICAGFFNFLATAVFAVVWDVAPVCVVLDFLITDWICAPFSFPLGSVFSSFLLTALAAVSELFARWRPDNFATTHEACAWAPRCAAALLALVLAVATVVWDVAPS